MGDHFEILRVLRHNSYLDLRNSSNKFGNHCSSKIFKINLLWWMLVLTSVQVSWYYWHLI